MKIFTLKNDQDYFENCILWRSCIFGFFLALFLIAPSNILGCNVPATGSHDNLGVFLLMIYIVFPESSLNEISSYTFLAKSNHSKTRYFLGGAFRN